jgi:ketosteroid isomerase-like protein
MHAIGDRVVVISRVEGRSRHAGVRLEDRRAAVWTFSRGGRVRRIEHYAEPREALAAAGLARRQRRATPRFAPAAA